MKVSPASPFKLIYSLFQHEYLGYLFESFVVQVDHLGKLTFAHQNISAKNAKEFADGLDEKDYQLIKEMDSMQQDAVVNHFHKKKIKTNEFFLKTYDKTKGNKLLQQEIAQYLERRRSNILPLLPGKEVYEMGNDGEPAWKKLNMDDEKATVLFHFRKNEDNTHYFPTIKHKGEKLEFQYKNAFIVCNDPAWMVLEDKMISFEKNVDGNKIKPFLNKKFIVIPKNIEETYYQKFVSQIVGSYDVYAKGFEIKTLNERPVPVLTIQELASVQKDLFGNHDNNGHDPEQGKMLIDLCFQYGEHRFAQNKDDAVSVKMNKHGEDYTFYRINRNSRKENDALELVRDKGLPINGSKLTLPKPRAMEWVTTHLSDLESEGFIIRQEIAEKKYYLGRSEISIEVKENIDWFDIHAVVRFGEFEIPFKELRKYILKKKTEFTLPNGEIAVIPESWFTEYSELFAFSEDTQDEDVKLKKHHLALVQELSGNNLAKVSLNRKLQNLQDFDSIEEYEMPEHFKGKLRPYQKAGYNWLNFLHEFRFGGCLADDMGLGKTVQTLALLQNTVNQNKGVANLLIMPTSLVYNWQMEAKKFTPKLKVLVYTGTDRNKNVERFKNYDLILTSYGITRLDIDILSSYYFNYIILDESQAIKNPDSIIAKAVRKLNSKNRLILTGTPVENSTMDLWSQMSFINPGLLGGQSFFTKDFLIPIEKKKDEAKTQKLYTLIKPFVLRRDKSQVAKDLPEKVENVNYCTMSEDQQKAYDEAKDFYRNKILDQIEADG
ncbi:MAG: SNF2-related protein, partial [Bacteroidota bacterium]